MPAVPAFARLSELTGARLEWRQPHATGTHFELRGEDHLFGTLEFRSSTGTLATAATAEGAWTFKRVGFLDPHVTVRVAGGDTDVAVYRPGFWGGGVVRRAGGAELRWASANFWATAWAFRDAAGRALVTFAPGAAEAAWTDLLKSQAVVTVDPAAASHPELALLAALGWYLVLLQKRDMAVVAATSAAAVS